MGVNVEQLPGEAVCPCLAGLVRSDAVLKGLQRAICEEEVRWEGEETLRDMRALVLAVTETFI